MHGPLESKALDLADPKDISTEPLPAQKVLKIFSINIIAQGLPFCRRRVSTVLFRLIRLIKAASTCHVSTYLIDGEST